MTYRPSAKLNKATSTGKHYEALACRHLEQAGLKIVARNYRRRVGELDLVMLDHEQLVFVEVKFRSDERYGDGLAQVDYRKQQKLRRTAEAFLIEHPGHAQRCCRFDVVAITGEGSACTLRWIQGAFE